MKTQRYTVVQIKEKALKFLVFEVKRNHATKPIIHQKNPVED